MQRHRYNLYKKAAELGTSKAHMALGNIYHVGGDKKKAKFHYEAAAMVRLG
jgi:TPR repeat protein